jgi:DNA-binding HxlR family transcriptional regulator
MTRYPPGHRSHCPISFALDILGDRWTLVILRDLLMRGKKTYGELLASEEGIATNVLADRLNWLEHHGIVRRTARVYRVTQKGLDLLPMMLEMVSWSARYDPLTAAPPPMVKQLAQQRDAVLAAFVESYTKSATSRGTFRGR